MATDKVSPVAVLRDARASFDKLRTALVRTRLTDDIDMIRDMETRF